MHRQGIAITAYVLTLVFAISLSGGAFGQECPSASTDGPSVASQARTLEGLLVFHDGIRQWFELKLDKPECKQGSIELMTPEKLSPSIEVFRGCRIKSTGTIDFSPTGYYTLDIFQRVETIEPAGACAQQPPFPDHSRSKPAKGIRAYRVDMYVSQRRGDHPVIFHVSSMGRELRPWQAYASYWLTGAFVLYGHCGEGFVIDTVFGTPSANPRHFLISGMPGDMAAFDPENAGRSGNSDLHMGYTCIREPG